MSDAVRLATSLLTITAGRVLSASDPITSCSAADRDVPWLLAQSSTNAVTDEPRRWHHELGVSGGTVGAFLTGYQDEMFLDVAAARWSKADIHCNPREAEVNAESAVAMASGEGGHPAFLALFDVTLRTARRALHGLEAEGLAWPRSPTRSGKAGRPSWSYQLLAENPAP